MSIKITQWLKYFRGYFRIMQPKCNQRRSQPSVYKILSGFESHVLRANGKQAV